MAKFIYKFESIKKTKEALEKKAQKEVAVIDLEIAKLTEEFKQVEDEEIKSKRSWLKKDISISEIKFKKNYELLLNRKKSALMIQIEKMNEKKDLKLKELIEKSKEHKIFETLEETYHENFISEQNHLELKFIDELATQKYVRQTK